MDEVVTKPQLSQTEANQDSSQPALKQQTVEPILQQPLEPTFPQKKRWILLTLVVIVVLALGTSVYFVYKNVKKPTDTPTSTNTSSMSSSDQQPTIVQASVTPIPTNSSIINGTDYLIERSYISSDGNYLLKVSINSSQASEQFTNQCDYSLSSKDGSQYDLTKILKTPKVSCSVGQGMISSIFLGWISNDTFALEEVEGNIKLVSLPSLQVNDYSYDSSEYKFEAVSNLQQYWLFRKKSSPKDKSTFIILGEDKNIVLDNLEFNQNENEHVLSILFDPINNGFLFTVRNYFYDNESSRQMSFVKFDFLDVTNMKLRNLLTTESIEAPGRGCGGYDEISSKPGEIIVFITCITVGDEYLDSDGKVHIKL